MPHARSPMESAWAAGSAVLPGASAILAASAGGFPANAAPETAAGRAASFPPSPSPGTRWAARQPWELRRLLLFFLFFSFSFKTSLYDSTKCLLLPIAWPGQADLVELESTGPDLQVLVCDLPWRPCVTLGATLYLCGPVSPSVKRNGGRRRKNCL